MPGLVGALVLLALASLGVTGLLAQAIVRR
jgi:hypothetical protein